MKLIFLGTGSAFTTLNYQTNVIVQKNGKNFLIDAGSDIRFSLKNVGLSYRDIDSVYVSHLHADHAGGIETLAFCSFFDPNKKQKITLYGSGDVLTRGWNTCWKGGLESIQGRLQDLGDYFKHVSFIEPNSNFTWEDIKFTPVQVIHVMNGYSVVSSWGLMLHDLETNKNIFFTTDTQFCPHQINDFYNMSDLIIQDCETSPFKSGVHSNYEDLKTLPENIKQKMILVHYQDNILNDDCTVKEEWSTKITDDKFGRFGTKGMIYEI
jgi:ribonuclease BN (tRNA processing enzyme)